MRRLRAAGISRVEIREKEFDVTVCEGTEDTYRLEESSEGYHDVTLENGVLRIVRNKRQPERRLFFSTSGELTLYLPKGQIQALDVTTCSGDMEVRKDLKPFMSPGRSDVTLSGAIPARSQSRQPAEM